MFFMGGMTLGYLDPPRPAKKQDTPSVASADEKGGFKAASVDTLVLRTDTVERTLLWARRILC